MTKAKPSLAAFAAGAVAPPAAKPKSTPEAPKARRDRPHTTLYLDPKVLRVIRQVALDFDRKPHDILLEGVNLALAHYAQPSISEITGGAAPRRRVMTSPRHHVTKS